MPFLFLAGTLAQSDHRPTRTCQVQPSTSSLIISTSVKCSKPSFESVFHILLVLHPSSSRSSYLPALRVPPLAQRAHPARLERRGDTWLDLRHPDVVILAWIGAGLETTDGGAVVTAGRGGAPDRAGCPGWLVRQLASWCQKGRARKGRVGEAKGGEGRGRDGEFVRSGGGKRSGGGLRRTKGSRKGRVWT